MARAPKHPEEIFPEFVQDCRQAFGDDVLSVVLYGSGAGQNYVPGSSDLNFLVVLTEEAVDKLDAAMDMVRRWRRQRVAVPLFMTPGFLAASLDAYPVELLDMRQSHILVWGRDCLEELSFDPRHVRLQVERELRGKLLHLRTGFLAAEDRVEPLRELIGKSLTALLALFRALLYIGREEIPADRRELIRVAAGTLPISPETFLLALEIREGKDRLSGPEVRAFVRTYLRETTRLTAAVDALRPGEGSP